MLSLPFNFWWRRGIWSWRGVCLEWWGGHSKHLEICVAMSTGGERERERRRERRERGMIDDDEREEREDKAFCVCS